MDLKRLLNDSHTNEPVLFENPHKSSFSQNTQFTYNSMKKEPSLPPATSLLNFVPSPQTTTTWVHAQPNHFHNNYTMNTYNSGHEKPIKTNSSQPAQTPSQETGPHGFAADTSTAVQQDVVLGLNDFMVFLNAHSKRPSGSDMDIPSPFVPQNKKPKTDSNPESPSMSPASSPPSTPVNTTSPGNAIDELYDELWMRHFRELQKFQKEFGHTNVTRTKPEYKPLGNWVAEQRRKMRQQRLAQHHVQLLSSIGFEWDRSYYYHCKVPRPKSI